MNLFPSMKNSFTTFAKKFVFAVSLLFVTGFAQGQVINEGFEEPVWTSVATGAIAASTVNVTAYVSTTAVSLSTYNTGAWSLNSGYVIGGPAYTANTANSLTSNVHSGSYALYIGAHSDAYLITPEISNGVTSVTVWATSGSSSGALNMFVLTNTNNTFTSAATNISATATSGTAWSQWSNNSSSYLVNSKSGWTQLVYSITNNASNNPCFIKFQRNSSEITIDDIIITSNNAPLPVVFSNISTKSTRSTTVVNWSVVTESGIIQYNIERSGDGNNFTAVGSEPATGHAGNYSFTDEQPLAGVNYYRVVAVSTTSELMYSAIVKVNITGENPPSVKVFPNPVTNGHFNIEITNEPAGNYGIQLLNEAGQLVYQTQISNAGGVSTQSASLPNTLTPGYYQLDIITPKGNRVTNKIIIN